MEETEERSVLPDNVKGMVTHMVTLHQIEILSLLSPNLVMSLP